ncbi:MAG: serine/threonine-protein kinase [Kofleriaceae bacterium]
MTIAPGQQVGNYRVLSRLGVGGMGAVYLAEHPVIGKKVALKVIHRELAGNREVIGRFYQEARAVTTIGNEHIVEIHDFGQSPEGDHFFLMEYVDGRTLAQVLTRERLLDVPRALHICAQIALALAATHAAGIIHRDLKPDNVMLCSRGGDPDFVKLLDFGLAKVMSDGAAKNLTAAGVILGTPQYMSPEACESKKVDHRTDVYALGVLLFQMLCGQVPFDGDTMGAVLIKQVTQAPPAPRGLSTLIPPAVEQIILRCLAKAPDARFPSMAALYDALVDPDRYLGSAPAGLPAAQPSAAARATTSYAVGTNAALGLAATAGMSAAESDPFGLGTAATQNVPLAGPIAAQARTVMFDGGGPVAPVGVAPPSMAPPRTTGGVAVPHRSTAAIAVPQNHTLVIATPPGYSSQPPRRRGPGLVVGAAIAVVALATVVVLVATGGGGSGGSAPAVGDAGSLDAGAGATVAARASGPPVDAGPAIDASGPAVDAAALVPITLTSEPSGAEVVDADGRVLGVTPLELALAPDGQPRTLTFRRAGRLARDKVVVVTGPMTVAVVLDPAPRAPGGRKPSGGRAPTPPNNRIMEPKL